MSQVVVVRPDNNGDVLLAGPAIRAVAASSERVTLWCGTRGRAAAGALPGVDAVLCEDLPWIDPAPAPVTVGFVDDVVARLRDLGCDRAIVFGSFHQSPLPTALLCRLAGIRFVGATSTDYPGSLLDVRHLIDDDVHEVVRSLSLAAACGYDLPPSDHGDLQVVRAAEPDLDADTLAARDAARGAVVVHPGASVPARTWQPERFRSLTATLTATGYRVVVTGSPAERELTATVAAGGDPARTVDLGGRTSWTQLTEVLAAAQAIVVGNTGPAHLAAAVGTPVVSLHPPTVPAIRWRPWAVAHELLGDQDISCAGCRARDCPFPGHPCLAEVTDTDVGSAIRRLTSSADDLVASGSVPTVAGSGRTGARRQGGDR